ncbi:MAG: corrinoid protein [Candidatus Marinimicrobia bacterium]|nr:corrinoid protein [Candidatus Neomarinimicrobiota bacterium]
MNELTKMSEALQVGNDKVVYENTQKAIEKGIPAKTILDDGLIAGMNIIGEKFRKHEIFLPHVLLAAKAMYAGMDLLKPLFVKDKIPSRGKIVIGTVQGDLHDIGKNLVGIMLKGAGFEVIDLGKDVSVENFVNTAQKENADVIGMSALLTTTQPVMKKVVEKLKEKGLYNKIKTIIGGAPLSSEYADLIGANAYSYDAANAVVSVSELVE